MIYNKKIIKNKMGLSSLAKALKSVLTICKIMNVSREIFYRVTLSFILVASVQAYSQARDYVTVVGSSTVYPFATTVAERFGRSTNFRTPKIESTGSGGGLKLFCSGVGVNRPDIANSSRRIKKSEVEHCKKNGVTDIVEVKVGYDGIVLANSKKSDIMKISRRDIFLALAREVPNPSSGTADLVPNPYQTWKDVNDTLPDRKIVVYGPPPTSGTRDAFVELALESGCKSFDFIRAIKKQDKRAYKAICHSIREDGAYVDSSENDNLIIKKLQVNPGAFGIFGFSFLDQNTDRLHGSMIDGAVPEFETIASGEYPVSRSLYFYVKKAHIGLISGIEGYLEEFSRERTWGDEGYLTDKGLIPMSEEERIKFKADIESLTPLALSD